MASSRKASTWRSAAQTGAAATELTALGGSRVKVELSTAGGARTLRGNVQALPPAPGSPVPTPGTPGPTLVRDDAAGQAAMAAGDLLLEWASFGASGRTAEYRRIWMLGDGSFRLNVIDWNDVSGEICRQTVTGTWVFKEGYTTTYNGGGVVVKVGLAFSNGTGGDEVFAFPTADANSVYVGPQGVQYSAQPADRAELLSAAFVQVQPSGVAGLEQRLQVAEDPAPAAAGLGVSSPATSAASSGRPRDRGSRSAS